ncbi:MAG: polysaccharide biosynthesis protein [Zoogloeaceae bacterium]|jgi:FlaA1/EpsC-like NDP-sugar epimerase|nr:polysaccharide biosynthesis protein [Zoogloeaceae bacterium]
MLRLFPSLLRRARPGLLRFVAFSYDLCVLALAWVLAYSLRFNFTWTREFLGQCLSALPLMLIVHASVYQVFGLYRGLWRYASSRDLLRIVGAVSLGALLTAVLVFMLYTSNTGHVPRSVLVLHPMLLILFMGGGRFAYRLAREWRQYGHLDMQGERVLVIGAGSAGARLVRELRTSLDWQVAAFLDDDPGKRGREIHGIKVHGSIREVGRVAAALDLKHVVIALPGVASRVRRRAMELAVGAGLKVLTVPALEDILSGRITVSHLRQIDLEDLLKREAVQLDESGLSGMLSERVVLVTGAGGSIGSELVRQIAHFRPRRIVLYEHAEFALFEMSETFRREFPEIPVCAVVGDVKDEARLEGVFAAHHPDYVFHAAAYKHVPLMEDENAWEAVRNNVGGTRALALAAARHGVRKMVLISTDKAINPTNVMGCTKRLAEMLLFSLAEGSGKTRFLAVRFGNVLGSNGSVIPTFQRQIAQGGPVTVTHPDITRYFMLIPEAAQLVLQAALMGEGGEIFLLDMGEPIRIMDLARDMILLSGHTEAEIPIQITGLRPGEKLYEELLADDETSLPTPHAKLRIAKAAPPLPAQWRQELETWLAQPRPQNIKAELKKRVPEYQPGSF